MVFKGGLHINQKILNIGVIAANGVFPVQVEIGDGGFWFQFLDAEEFFGAGRHLEGAFGTESGPISVFEAILGPFGRVVDTNVFMGFFGWGQEEVQGGKAEFFGCAEQGFFLEGHRDSDGLWVGEVTFFDLFFSKLINL